MTNSSAVSSAPVRRSRLLLAPPYICTPQEIEIIVERLGEAVDALVKEAAH